MGNESQMENGSARSRCRPARSLRWWPHGQACSSTSFPFGRRSSASSSAGPIPALDQGAIPLGEIVIYAELMQMPVGDEREQFVQIIRAMDGAYLTWAREKHG